MRALALVLALASVTLADDLPMTPPRWSKATPAPPAATRAPQALPAPPPVLPAPVSDVEDTEDPRDVPPPSLYGTDLETGSGTIYYVLDVSGSMNYDAGWYVGSDGRKRWGTRYERARQELLLSIAGLSESLRFGVLRYSCRLERWRPRLEEATARNKAAVKAWLLALRWPDGATATGPATALALGDKAVGQVVLLTDGAPNCGATPQTPAAHRAMIRGANTQSATVSVFGIVARGPCRSFCVGVAADNGGSYYDVP